MDTMIYACTSTPATHNASNVSFNQKGKDASFLDKATTSVDVDNKMMEASSRPRWDGNDLSILKRKIESAKDLSGDNLFRAENLLKYKENIESSGGFKRIGIESQCNDVVLFDGQQSFSRNVIKRKDGKFDIYNYNGEKGDLPLEKGQVLAECEDKIAGYPLLSVTVEGTDYSDKYGQFAIELITAPMTAQEFKDNYIQQSLDDFKAAMRSMETGQYSIEELIELYNNTKREGSQKLLVGDSFSLFFGDDYKGIKNVAKRARLDVCKDLDQTWFNQANISLPFESLSKITDIIAPGDNDHFLVKNLNGVFENKVISDLLAEASENPTLHAWLKHLVYLSFAYSNGLNKCVKDQCTTFGTVKSCSQNFKYSHHQLIMEVLDDEGIRLIKSMLLDNSKKRDDLLRVLLYIADAQGHEDKIFGLFCDWMDGYFNDLAELVAIREKTGRCTVFDASTEAPYVLANNKKIYLPFDAGKSVSKLVPLSGFYKHVLPLAVDKNDKIWTVLERRSFPSIEAMMKGEHFPFSYNSRWAENPTEQEKQYMDCFWA